MQHFGWLETLIYARYPQHELVFRNLGYSGDEVNGYRDLYSRMRSMDFGSQDQWLAGHAPIPQPQKLNNDAPVSARTGFGFTNTRADVIFAFYGYNESFAGAAGLNKFKDELGRFIKHTLAQRYNGKSAPRLVLFSPIAHENLGDPNLPDGVENNRRLELYTQAMAEVAQADGCVFRRSVHPLAAVFAPTAGPKLDDQRHPSERCRETACVAGMAYQGLFGEPPAFDDSDIEKLAGRGQRQELVLVQSLPHDRRLFDLRRPRVSAVCRRADELRSACSANWRSIDLLTSNRDKVVWAAAQGRDDQARRFQSARLHSGSHEQAGTAAGRKAPLSERRGRNRKDDRPQRDEGQPVRLRGASSPS